MLASIVDALVAAAPRGARVIRAGAPRSCATRVADEGPPTIRARSTSRAERAIRASAARAIRPMSPRRPDARRCSARRAGPTTVSAARIGVRRRSARRHHELSARASPWYAVSIAAVYDGAPIGGASSTTSTRDEMFTATLGGGARLAGEPIARHRDDRAGARAHRDRLSLRRQRGDPALRRQFVPVQRAPPAFAAAAPRRSISPGVACGRFDAFWELTHQTVGHRRRNAARRGKRAASSPHGRRRRRTSFTSPLRRRQSGDARVAARRPLRTRRRALSASHEADRVRSQFFRGTRPDVVTAIRDAHRRGGGRRRFSTSPPMRRTTASVITFVAPVESMVDAAFAANRAARDNIDLRTHAGVHPRIGAADVVPFIPLDGATMEDCIALARAARRARWPRAARFPSFCTSTPQRARRARISPTCVAAVSRAFAPSIGSDAAARAGLRALAQCILLPARSRSARGRFSSRSTFTSAARAPRRARHRARRRARSSGGLPALKALASRSAVRRRSR